jgi:hypothetical protein
MPLTHVERRITQVVVRRFLELKESTPRKLLVRQFRSLESLKRMTTFPILKKVNRSGSNGATRRNTSLSPLAFHYSDDPDTVTRARTSVEVVLRVLQNMFDVELTVTMRALWFPPASHSSTYPSLDLVEINHRHLTRSRMRC